MLLQNSVGIESPWGYRTFELYEGDLTEPEASADLVVVSAFAGDYSPIPGTALGSLHRKCGIDARLLGRALDLIGPFGLWISVPLPDVNFKWLMCVELLGGAVDIAEALRNVFVAVSVMEAKGWRVESMTMPLLGAGQQALEAQGMIDALIPAASDALRRSSTLSRVLFVEKDRGRVEQLSSAMNRLLQRSNVTLRRRPLIANLQEDICTNVDRAMPAVPEGHRRLFIEMRRVLEREELASRRACSDGASSNL
jgi:hypothetical protein